MKQASTKNVLLALSVIVVVFVAGFGLYTVLNPKESYSFVLLYENDPLLYNPYSVILVNPELHPNVKFHAAAEFAKWLISDQGQQAIASYKKYGTQLFHPDFNASSLSPEEKSFWDNVTIGSSPPSEIMLATTTSTRDSGLLDYLIPLFEKVSNVTVKYIGVGTGAALDTARQGNADIVMVHAKRLELEFVQEGHGIHRVHFMYNDFVVVGPSNDPANIKNAQNVTDAFIRIYQTRSLFVSRGDNSGTNVKELSIWASAGVTINPDNETWAEQNSWYIESGQGMSNTLMMAYNLKAYTLTDRATWLAIKSNF